MSLVKLQLEIKYRNILNFQGIYRKIVQPYIDTEKVEFIIYNQNLLEEYITINYSSFGFMVELRWDRMFIVVEGDSLNLKPSTSPMKYFFEIYNQLKTETNVVIKTSILACWYVHIIEKTESEILNSFKNRFLNSQITPALAPEDVNDISIQLVNQSDGTINRTVTVGPFNKNDIKKHNLASLNNNKASYLENKLGEMCQIQINNIESTISITKFRERMDSIEEITQKLFTA